MSKIFQQNINKLHDANFAAFDGYMQTKFFAYKKEGIAHDYDYHVLLYPVMHAVKFLCNLVKLLEMPFYFVHYFLRSDMNNAELINACVPKLFTCLAMDIVNTFLSMAWLVTRLVVSLVKEQQEQQAQETNNGLIDNLVNAAHGLMVEARVLQTLQNNVYCM